MKWTLHTEGDAWVWAVDGETFLEGSLDDAPELEPGFVHGNHARATAAAAAAGREVLEVGAHQLVRLLGLDPREGET